MSAKKPQSTGAKKSARKAKAATTFHAEDVIDASPSSRSVHIDYNGQLRIKSFDEEDTSMFGLEVFDALNLPDHTRYYLRVVDNNGVQVGITEYCASRLMRSSVSMQDGGVFSSVGDVSIASKFDVHVLKADGIPSRVSIRHLLNAIIVHRANIAVEVDLVRYVLNAACIRSLRTRYGTLVYDFSAMFTTMIYNVDSTDPQLQTWLAMMPACFNYKDALSVSSNASTTLKFIGEMWTRCSFDAEDHINSSNAMMAAVTMVSPFLTNASMGMRAVRDDLSTHYAAFAYSMSRSEFISNELTLAQQMDILDDDSILPLPCPFFLTALATLRTMLMDADLVNHVMKLVACWVYRLPQIDVSDNDDAMNLLFGLYVHLSKKPALKALPSIILMMCVNGFVTQYASCAAVSCAIFGKELPKNVRWVMAMIVYMHDFTGVVGSTRQQQRIVAFADRQDQANERQPYDSNLVAMFHDLSFKFDSRSYSGFLKSSATAICIVDIKRKRVERDGGPDANPWAFYMNSIGLNEKLKTPKVERPSYLVSGGSLSSGEYREPNVMQVAIDKVMTTGGGFVSSLFKMVSTARDSPRTRRIPTGPSEVIEGPTIIGPGGSLPPVGSSSAPRVPLIPPPTAQELPAPAPPKQPKAMPARPAMASNAGKAAVADPQPLPSSLPPVQAAKPVAVPAPPTQTQSYATAASPVKGTRPPAPVAQQPMPSAPAAAKPTATASSSAIPKPVAATAPPVAAPAPVAQSPSLNPNDYYEPTTSNFQNYLLRTYTQALIDSGGSGDAFMREAKRKVGEYRTKVISGFTAYLKFQTDQYIGAHGYAPNDAPALVKKTQEKLDALAVQHTVINTEKLQLALDLQAAATEIATIKQREARATIDIVTLQAALVQAKADLAVAQAPGSASAAEIVALKTEIKNLNNDVTLLQNDRKTASDAYMASRTRADKLQQKLDAMHKKDNAIAREAKQPSPKRHRSSSFGATSSSSSSSSSSAGTLGQQISSALKTEPPSSGSESEEQTSDFEHYMAESFHLKDDEEYVVVVNNMKS